MLRGGDKGASASLSTEQIQMQPSMRDVDVNIRQRFMDQRQLGSAWIASRSDESHATTSSIPYPQTVIKLQPKSLYRL